MSAIILDTLEYANKLKAAGFTEQQAEVQARALAEIVEKQLVTKAEVAEHENNLRRDIEALRVELKHDIAELRKDMEIMRAELKRDIKDVEAKLAETKVDIIRWTIGAGIFQTALIAALLLKLVH